MLRRYFSFHDSQTVFMTQSFDDIISGNLGYTVNALVGYGLILISSTGNYFWKYGLNF